MLGDEYEDEFGDKFRSNSKIMHDYVQNEKKRIKIIKQAEKEVEREKELRAKTESKRVYDGKVSLMNHVYDEIKFRARHLEK